MMPRNPASGGASRTQPTRPYLRAADRRRQLLDTAACLAAREGLDRLSIVGIAGEAGVSRQLVYEHFADLPTLVMDLLVDRLGGIDTANARVLADPEMSGRRAILTAAERMLAVPAADRQLVRELLVHSGTPDHELHAPAQRLRRRMLDRWGGVLERLGVGAARPRAWILVNALLGLGECVDAGELELGQALTQFAVFVDAAVS